MATPVDLENKGDCLFLQEDLFGHNYNGPAKIFMRTKMLRLLIGNAFARILDDESLTVSKPEAFQNTQGSYSKIAMATDTSVRAIQEFGYKYLHIQLAKGNIFIFGYLF
ncbi:hypothetical protein DPMN_019547 [Dreissena polymorpha]|uniref:Uncharacterized protein n=1 Tax=Dreissena polymorpha TaxID=45954 RepID=A0A9D4NF83_DREPO|nr:hypothetical protein DPMN_019547 [Dreissena polymorpha]